MGKDVTARPGRYSVSTTPYMKEPQEAFTALEVQVTVLYMAKRMGKTEGLMNLIGSVIDQNPRNILVAYPTIDSSKKWSKQFLTPMCRSTPCLKDKIRDSRTREANNTILSKEFPGGTISAIGSNSDSGFRQIQAPVVVCDEIDTFEDSFEGDPVTRAFGRSENYSDSIQVVSSTATRLFRIPEKENEGHTTGSRIHDWYLKSDQRKWFVKNPCCGNWHVLAWENVKWPEGHKHEEAWYECPDCHAHWNDEIRLQAVMSGEWRATAEFRGVRGYWLNGLNTTFAPKKGYKSKLHQMAAEFYDAYTSGEGARIAWKNTFLCEPHIEETEKIDVAPLFDRQEDYSPDALPNEICVIGISCDVQGDRIEYEFIGMGEGEETWGIEYGKIQGDPEKDAVWTSLRHQVNRKFKRRDGVELQVDCIGIDHAHKGGRVRKFLRTCGHQRAWAIYGSSGKQQTLVTTHHSKNYRMNLHSVNTDKAKDTVYSRLRIKDPGTGYMHYPKGFGYEKQSNGYFDQLTAEEVRITYKKGFPVREYVKVRSRNEALDIRVYFLAAMDILKPVMAEIQKGLLRQLQPKPVEKEYVLKPEGLVPKIVKPVQQQRRPRMASGWNGGFGKKWL